MTLSAATVLLIHDSLRMSHPPFADMYFGVLVDTDMAFAVVLDMSDRFHSSHKISAQNEMVYHSQDTDTFVAYFF